MASDPCKRRGESGEPGYELCWRCGTHVDGTPRSVDFILANTLAPTDAAPVRALTCLRCEGEMSVVRRMDFHEGTRLRPVVLGDVGELLVNR